MLMKLALLMRGGFCQVRELLGFCFKEDFSNCLLGMRLEALNFFIELNLKSSYTILAVKDWISHYLSLVYSTPIIGGNMWYAFRTGVE